MSKKVSGPDISPPKGSGPDVSVNTPDAKLPDMSLKGETPSASINGPNVSLNGPDVKTPNVPSAEEPSLLEEISANIPGWSSVQVGGEPDVKASLPDVKGSLPEAKLSATAPSLSAGAPEEPPYATINKAREMAGIVSLVLSVPRWWRGLEVKGYRLEVAGGGDCSFLSAFSV